MQRLLVLVLIAWLPGCGPLRAVLAPQSILTDTAGRVGSGAAQTVDNVATQQTIADVDRIIATRGDSENIDELRRLKGDLEANPLTTTKPAKTRLRREAPPREFDRRQRPEKAGPESLQIGADMTVISAKGETSRRGHRLVANPDVGPTHRGLGEPFAASRGHLLPPARRKIYDLDFHQVRAHQPQAVKARR